MGSGSAGPQGNFRAYVLPDRPACAPGQRVNVNVVLESLSDKGLQTQLELVDQRGESLWREAVGLQPLGRATELVRLTAPDVGTWSLKLLADGKLVDEAKIVVAEPSNRKPLVTLFVWHNHQAPNYMPNGVLHAKWAFTYVYGDMLRPYGKGPYSHHLLELERHPSYRATFNVSPSLLAQWLMAVEGKAKFSDGTTLGDYEVEQVRRALEGYERAAKAGRIEVLTSLYAHTIAGFLLEHFGMHDIVAEELKYGAEMTSKALGGYRARGAWTPEMSFSMDLVEIYHSHEIEYTVLDERNHFAGAKGDKGTPHEPYILVDRERGAHVVVFFRDAEISNALSFENNFESEGHAWKAAYNLVSTIVARWLDPATRTLTIALDGENWMAFSKNPPLTAYFYDRLVTYLESAQDGGFIKLSTLGEALEEVPAMRVLYGVTSTSWLGGYSKWRGERKEHEEKWRAVGAAYRKVKAYEESFGGDELSRRARWSLWHALDSDYWWAEFWSPTVIDAWLADLEGAVGEALKRIALEVSLGGIDAAGAYKAVAKIRNDNDKEARLTLSVMTDAVEVVGGAHRILRVGPHASIDAELAIEPRYVGSLEVPICLTSGEVAIVCKNLALSSP
ncbi:MAG: glycoside hydrolase family 57 [Desulfurococcaceae archaeon]